MENALYATLILAVLACIAGMFAFLLAFLREFKKPQDILRQTYTSACPTVQTELAEPKPLSLHEVSRLPPHVQAAVTQAIERSLSPVKAGPMPVAYCGHCGKGIYREAVEALDVGDLAVMAHECPECKKRTFLPQETGNQDG